MNNNETLERIRELNKKYAANDYNGILNTGNNTRVIPGNCPILLSAPHAVRQIRNGKIKGADTLTGPIVEVLCEKTGAHGIIRTFNLGDDPNNDNTGHGLAYKESIIDIAKKNNIKCIIDIHGCCDDYPFDIDIGTNDGMNINNNTSFLNVIREQFSAICETRIDCMFKASNKATVCNYVSRATNIPCFQIELSTLIRRTKTIQLLDSLTVIIANLQKQIQAEEVKKGLNSDCKEKEEIIR